MKEETFYLKLGQALDQIASLLSSRDTSFATCGPSFAITLDNDDSVKSIKEEVDDIVKDTFECKKASKYRKYNYHANKLYLQFKRHI